MDAPTSLTIVMPVYNERDTLRTALDRLLAVDMPVETEVVVVDDGSAPRPSPTWSTPVP